MVRFLVALHKEEMEGRLSREDKRRTTRWAPRYPSIRRLTSGVSSPEYHNEFAEFVKANPPDHLAERCSLRMGSENPVIQE